MGRALKFIHTADLHLDSPFKGMSNIPLKIFEEMKESTFLAFQEIVDTAIKEKVDFVLIVGDMFDEEARSLKAQLKARQAFEQLKEHDIDVFLSFGNHDHLGGTYFRMEYPNNVHIFTSETVETIPYFKNHEHFANIYGFSYEKKAITTGKVNEFFPTDEDVFHIGMLHGSLSSIKEHNVYAPFKISELTSISMDYWALGHIHKCEVLHDDPFVVYPGNIQGRHMKETGEKGFYLVQLDKDSCELNFRPSHQIQFIKKHLDTSSITTIDQLEKKINFEKETYRRLYGRSIIRLSVTIDEHHFSDSINETDLQELIDIINESEEDEVNWIWLEDIILKRKVTWNKEQLLTGKHFIGELLRQIDEPNQIDQIIEEIMNNKEIRKGIEPFSEEELEEIIQNAEFLLLSELMRE
jgi:DNA repair protein SbcD/Mre11